MNAVDEFKVSFGKIARTVVYSDCVGSMMFCFDVAPSGDPSKKKWTIYLGHRPLSEDGSAALPSSVSQTQIDTAIQRTTAYLVSCGYEVEEDSA